MIKEEEVKVGDHFTDPASPGRVVKVITIILDPLAGRPFTIETIRAAEVAVTARAVGRQTEVTRKTLSKMHFVDDECSFCGWNSTHRSVPSGYHCPVTD